MKKYLVVLACVSAFATLVWAGGERSKNGVLLTQALNGSAQFIRALRFQGDGGIFEPAAFQEGGNFMVQCDVATSLLNANNDAGATPAQFVRVAAEEKYAVGLLQEGAPVILFSANTDAGCNVFRQF